METESDTGGGEGRFRNGTGLSDCGIAASQLLHGLHIQMGIVLVQLVVHSRHLLVLQWVTGGNGGFTLLTEEASEMLHGVGLIIVVLCPSVQQSISIRSTPVTRRTLFATVALAAAITVFGASSVSAQVSVSIPTPVGTWGSIPGLTFSGTGIPTDVMSTVYGGVTLALGAHARCQPGGSCPNPPVTNNLAGTFFAQPGFDGNNPPGDNWATWNFDFAVVGTGLGSFNYFLFIDSDPAFDNTAGYYPLPVPGSQYPVGYQNSFNMGFNTTLDQFNPNAAGQYGFVLAAFDPNGAPGADPVFQTQMLVEVVPEPATMTLLATGLIGLAGAARRRKRSTKA